MGKKHNNEILNILLFLSLCVIGGTTYAFQKIGLEEGLPFWTAGMRFLIAGFCMLIYVCVTKKLQLNKTTIYTAILYGIFYFALPFGAVYWVGQYLPSGLLSVLSASVAVFCIGFNYMFKCEKISNMQIVGILLSMIGVFFIFTQSIFVEANYLTILCLVIALFAYLGAAFSTVFLKSKVQAIDQSTFTAIALCVGGIILTTTSMVVERGNRAFIGMSLVSVLYLAIVGSMLSTKITTYLMSKWNIAKVTAYRFISPVISLLVGFFFFSEELFFNELIGVVLIIGGSYFINRKKE